MTETENHILIADFLTFNESILDEIKSESEDLYNAVNAVINQLMFEEAKIYAVEPNQTQLMANSIGQYSDKSVRELKIIMDELKEFIQLIDDPNDADVVNSELSIDEIEQELFNRKN